MRIENLREETRGNNRKRVSASVIWEDSGRQAMEVYFETTEEFADGLWCNPHAFLVGSILPAMHHGEKRISIDAEICPDLREGLTTALSWIRHWCYRPESRIIQIETKARPKLPAPHPFDRAGFFFSGGIDGLTTIRLNRLYYPLEHPGSIKDALIMFGPYWESDNRSVAFEKAMIDLSGLARDAGIKLIPVYTNIRDLDRDTKLFIHEYHGAMLASVAHAFDRRLSVVTVSASEDIPSLSLLKVKDFRILGSHPLLDPNYSSSDMLIKHGSVSLSRLEKTRLLGDWQVALDSIKVCQPNWPSANCGLCEKCIRTELALLVLDLLDKTKSFPLNDVTEEQVRAVNLGPYSQERATAHQFYMELVEPLRAKGRDDLVRAVDDIIEQSIWGESKWKRKVKQFDSRYLNGCLLKLTRHKYT